ncbi:MAG: flagellar hook-associated protein FlgK [Lachnospiraceae bacterium]|nr:flagellar hook-associated protein FlgK [Lachnospiraceae bacterium]
MPSTFFGLNTAYLGLTAANASLNTTANNISNAQTEGYSRQHTVQQASDAIRVFAQYGCAGAGVETLAIERYRDEFYDVKYWNNSANLGEYDAKQYYMKLIEKYFSDNDSVEGFSTIFSDMFDSLQEIKKSAGESATRTQFLSKAINLTEYFNTMQKNLQDMQKDLNEEIKTYVSQINSYASELATMNQQINVIEMSGGTANELRDRRALIIDKLSEIVSVECEEQKVVDLNNPEHETGATRYIVKIAGGQPLVDDSSYNTINVIAREEYETVNQSDVVGLYDLKWDNGNTFSLTNAEMGGKLRGLIDLRDGNNGEYFHGKATGIGKATINGETRSTVTITVDDEYLTDLNKITLPENGKIKVGGREILFDQWTFNCEVNQKTGKTVYSYTFVMSDRNEDVSLTGLQGKEASVGNKIGYQGIPYYQEQMNEWVRCFAQAVNGIITQDGSIDNYGNAATKLLLADKITDDTQWHFDGYPAMTGIVNGQEVPISYKISCKDDTYYWLTASSFNISKSIRDDVNLLATRSGQVGDDSDESKYDIVDQLLDLEKSKEKMSFRGASAGEFLQCILSDIALNTQNADTFSKCYTTIGKSVENQRLSVSGVDADEEAVSLVKYQNAYTLASKMIQTLTEVYDRLILQTGV